MVFPSFSALLVLTVGGVGGGNGCPSFLAYAMFALCNHHSLCQMVLSLRPIVLHLSVIAWLRDELVATGPKYPQALGKHTLTQAYAESLANAYWS